MSEAQKPLTPTLLSITLGLEGAVVFFAALTSFGLKYLEMAPAFIGGGVLMVIFFLAAGLVRRGPWAVWLGWALQAVLLAIALVAVAARGLDALPMLVVAVLFIGLWIWCWIRGRTIDRANQARLATDPQGGTP